MSLFEKDNIFGDYQDNNHPLNFDSNQFMNKMNQTKNQNMLEDLKKNEGAPFDEHNLNYYQEYCKLFISNIVLCTQLKELVSEKNDLLIKLDNIKKKADQLQNCLNNNSMEESQKKRFRRTALEINRQYKCPIEICSKSYGSEGSLNQHIKIKHPEFYDEYMQQQLALNKEKEEKDGIYEKEEILEKEGLVFSEL